MITREKETCPECGSYAIDVDPAYENGEVTGSRYGCRNCGWNTTFEEDRPEDVVENRREIVKEWVLLESLPEDLQNRIRDVQTTAGESAK